MAATSGRSIVLLPGEGIAIPIPGYAVVFKAVGRDTGGSHAVFEVTIAAKSPAMPPHLHRAMDEEIFVTDGELAVRIGTQTIVAARGAYLAVPRGVAHAVANRGDAPATFLTIIHPAGFERYYRDLAAAFAAAGGMPDRETFAALLATYESELAL